MNGLESSPSVRRGTRAGALVAAAGAAIRAQLTGAAAAAARSTKAARAVAWANARVGSTAYSDACETFVEDAYGTSGQYRSASAGYRNLRAAGLIHTSAIGIPSGALVFSENSRWDLGDGHVMLSRGDGTFVSGGVSTRGGRHPTVQVFSGPAPVGGYLGWAFAPSSWPGV